ncbi:hypothetical protein PUR71_20845 [Streptomyces sp. SP17BM10]|uniref:hypothetical protein n=1 Tax=Streptomyces sp. SP17BM10 TaxID=3002530 RepID=UPI002E7A8424|nr:hypothetical protein [Streptomyces sp. SP17BM10]MEE1785341.1 hypothetical protein [Streptomyces sp. SP17BM10]
MATPRMLLTALLSCAAVALTVAGLTACTPVDENPTAVSASGESSGPDDDPADPADPGDPRDDPDDAVEAAPALPSPSASCSPAGEHPGHTVLRVVAADPARAADAVGSPDGPGLSARATRYLCAPNRFEPVGAPVRYTFAAAGVDAALADRQHGDPARPVPLPELLAHLDACLATRPPAAPDGCYDNTYDVVLDSHGRIMRITELGRP